MTGKAISIAQSMLVEFERALANLPDGYIKGRYRARTWSVTIQRSPDERRIWLYGSELGGTDIVSFNFYILSSGPMLMPCEMSSTKVIDFVLEFEPAPNKSLGSQK
jgi:hypothetical protein